MFAHLFLSKQRVCSFVISMSLQDLGEHGIAPRTFTTTDSFVSTETSRKRAIVGSSHSSVIPGDWLLNDLIVPEV